jgi:hypothetical protein
MHISVYAFSMANAENIRNLNSFLDPVKMAFTLKPINVAA